MWKTYSAISLIVELTRTTIVVYNDIPSLLTTLVVKSPLMDTPRSERYWLRAVVLVLAVAL
jgi:hypothetical protein